MIKAEISMIRSLSSRKGRAAEGLFVAEGEKLVEELLGSGFCVRKVFLRAEAAERLRERCAVVADTEVVSAKEMERISFLKTPGDVLALIGLPVTGEPEVPAPGELMLALDDVQDPGNLGTIVRLADWFGIRRIVCSEATADCFNPKVVQATMGAVARVRVHYTDLCGFLAAAGKKGVPLYGTFLDGENIYRAGLTPGGIVVMGNEGRGIAPRTASLVTRRLYIPPFPEGKPSSESLNVAVAAAVLCSEFRRR